MTELLNIKNGLVAVLKKGSRLSENLIKSCENATWEEIFNNPKKYSEIDILDSQILHEYLYKTTFDINPEEYSNKLSKAFQPNTPKTNSVQLHYPYKVREEQVPKALKNIGIQLERNVEYLRFEWSEKESKILIKDKKNKLVEYETPNALAEDKTITLFDNVFIFDKTDFAEIKKIENKIYTLEEEMNITDASDLVLEKLPLKYKELYKVYDDFLINEQNKNVMTRLNHEFKHIKNASIQESRFVKPNAGSICPEHAFEIEVEDERSASLEQVLGDIKTYLLQEDLDNFYELGCDKIIDDLETTKPEKRKELLLDKKYVVNAVLSGWAEDDSDLYEEQLEECMKTYASNAPLHKTKMDSKERDLILNSFYTVSFYDPKTEKDEFVNVFSLIKPKNRVKITDEIRSKYLLPAEQILESRNKVVQGFLPDSQIDSDTIKKAEEMAFSFINSERQKRLRKHKIYNNKQNYFHQISEFEQNNLKIMQPIFLKNTSRYTK